MSMENEELNRLYGMLSSMDPTSEDYKIIMGHYVKLSSILTERIRLDDEAEKAKKEAEHKAAELKLKEDIFNLDKEKIKIENRRLDIEADKVKASRESAKAENELAARKVALEETKVNDSKEIESKKLELEESRYESQIDISEKENEIANKKLKLEADRIVKEHEIEIDKINIEKAKIEASKEEFEARKDIDNRAAMFNLICEGAGILARLAGLVGSVYVARAGYKAQKELSDSVMMNRDEAMNRMMIFERDNILTGRGAQKAIDDYNRDIGNAKINIRSID